MNQPNNTVTRAQADSALRAAAQMIRRRIDGLPAEYVNQIARRLLPDFGLQAPRTKKGTVDLVTDFEKVNPLAALRAFAVGLHRDRLNAIRADMDGRVVEPGLFREAPAIPSDPGRSRAFYDPL